MFSNGQKNTQKWIFGLKNVITSIKQFLKDDKRYNIVKQSSTKFDKLFYDIL